MPFTKSNEHSWAAGTVWLSPETLLAMMRDIGRSLARLPARRLVLLNGHGGNTSMLDVVCRELRLEHDLLTFLLHPSLPADHGGCSSDLDSGLGIHGGASETSMLLHLRPDLVDMTLAVDNVPHWLNENTHVNFAGSAGFGWKSSDFGPSGVIGNATALDRSDIVRRLSGTLGDTLAGEPGVSSTFFGQGASRPVLRGLSAERVQVLTNGIGVIDVSAASPDHQVAADGIDAEKIEILEQQALGHPGPEVLCQIHAIKNLLARLRRSRLIWGLIPTPPKMTVERRGRSLP